MIDKMLIKKSDKLLHFSLVTGSILVLGILFALWIPNITDLLDNVMYQVETRTGSEINTYIFFIVLTASPIALLFLPKVKPISFIFLFIALLPIMSRLNAFGGIYAYTDFNGNNVNISGCAIIIPFLLIYLAMRYPMKNYFRNILLPSSLGYLCLVISTIISQLLFHGFIKALSITYIIIIVNFITYIVILNYINNIKDVYNIIIAIITATLLTSLLALYAESFDYQSIMNQTSLIRIDSISMGGNNVFAPLLSATICLIPAVIPKAPKWLVLFIIISLFFIVKTLILTGCRGAFFGLLPLLGYIYMMRKYRKAAIIFCITVIALFWIFYDEFIYYILSREIYLDTRIFGVASVSERIMWTREVLLKLMELPYFITGFGMGTNEHWVVSPSGFAVQWVHQGFAYIWVTSGLGGLIGFIYWIGHAISSGCRRISSSKNLEEKYIILSLIICISSWIISFLSTGGWYTSANVELYSILTAEVGMLVVLTQKDNRKLCCLTSRYRRMSCGP